MCRECYLIAKFLLGVHTVGGSEGIIKQDESISLQIKGQVGTAGEGKHICFVCTWVNWFLIYKNVQTEWT